MMRMKQRSRIWLLAALSGLPWAGNATILIFDQARDGATQSIVVPTLAGATAQQDYGDRVSSSNMSVLGGEFTYGEAGEGFTPNVSAEYLSVSGVNLWTIQYGDLTNVLFARAPLSNDPLPTTLGILLTADPGFEVQLYDFDLAGWPNTDYTIDGVSVSSDTATLFSQSDVLVEGDFSGPRHTEFDFGIPLAAASLLIEIDFGNIAGGLRDNIGIDNIRFGQIPTPSAIPLPAGLWLFASGMLGLALALRRRL